MENTEKIIVGQLKEGNEDAWKYLYKHHYSVLCCVANQYVSDTFQAETIVGDVIFHMWEIRESLDITISLRSYLVRAVRNRCMDYLNLEYRQKEISFCFPEELPESNYLYSDNSPLGILLEKELEAEIHKSIGKLHTECKAVFQKSRFERKKYEEISKELGISVNTVKYHIKSALSILRKDLVKYLLLFIFIFLQ